ncbi:MAG: hypothetical protein ACR2OJ_02145, partial [Hyphomicrobiales bacterium]
FNPLDRRGDIPGQLFCTAPGNFDAYLIALLFNPGIQDDKQWILLHANFTEVADYKYYRCNYCFIGTLGGFGLLVSLACK